MHRSVLRILKDACLMRRRVRIVVLGSAKSGKTVFLTALASHLKHHDDRSGCFNLNGWEASWRTDLKPEGEDYPPPFPYARYLNDMKKSLPEFPEKTTSEMSVLRMPLTFRKYTGGRCEKRRDVLLELMDLPGERVADLAMANKSYREWCEWMNRVFVEEKSSPSYCGYLEKANDAATADELFDAYKRHLVNEVENYTPWITPSIVKLTNGEAGKFKTVVWSRPLGVDSASQFVPIPNAAFRKDHRLNRFVKEFACGYEKYRRAVVVPIRDWLADADRLVYLVDVLGILKRGVAAYNAECTFGSDVIGMFRRAKTRVPVFGSIWDGLAGLFQTRISSAHLVATKADLVAGGLEGRSKMSGLAEQILGKAFRELDLGDLNVSACAAVETVRTLSDKTSEGVAKTVARQVRDSNEASEYSQPDIPERWPTTAAQWNEQMEKCWFADPLPLFEARCDAVPPQIGLDDLVRALLKGDIF